MQGLTKGWSGVFALVGVLAACGPEVGSLQDEGGPDDEGTESVSSELTSTSSSATWFPMAEGNTWTFQATGSSTTTRTVRFAKVANKIGELSGLLSAPTWLGVTEPTSTTTYAWSADDGWLPFLRFGYASTSWSFGTSPCSGFKMSRTSTGTAVTTPAGTFSDTRSIGLQQITSPTVRCAAPAVTNLTFVPQVGLVAFTTGSGQRFVLKEATVNGKRYPAPAGRIDAKVTLNASSYVSYPNTIRCITVPCPTNEVTAVVKATFEVSNTTSGTVKWEFNTGCQFDLEVVSSSGIVLQRLSNTQLCTQALSSLTLAPQQKRTYTGSVTLLDRTGLQLDGSFTLRARMTPRSGPSPAPSASAPFSVRVANP